MMKIFKSMGARAFAPVLCTIGGLSLAFSILIATLFAAAGGGEKLYNRVYDEIAEAYALYALETIEAGKQHEVEDYFAKRGISCSVVKYEYDDEMDGTSTETPIFEFGELGTSAYEDMIIVGGYYEYNIDSLMWAFYSGNYAGSNIYSVHVPVIRVVFDKERGYLYYETENLFYKVGDIVVYQNGLYTDYLLMTINGKEVYYNGYYEKALDTTQYKTWDCISVSDVAMPLVEEDRYDNMISVVTSDYIEEKGIGGFVIDANISYVECYPVGYNDQYEVRIDWKEPEAATETSLFQEWKSVHIKLMQYENYIIPNIILGILLLAMGLVLLVYSAKNDKEKMGLLHKAPIGIYSFLVFCAEVGLAWVTIVGIPMLTRYYGDGSVELAIVLWSVTGGVMLWLAFVCLQTIVTRIKCRSFWRTTEFYYSYVLIKQGWKFIAKPVKWCWGIITTPFRMVAEAFRGVKQLARENTPLFIGGLIIIIVIATIELIVLGTFRYDGDMMVITFIMIKLVEAVLISIVLLQVQRLHEGSKRIASGDLSTPVDTSKMFWKLKEHGENINKVSEGISLAVKERMKSEHFKTELITNVSHDIKTPLTSIINYVDLIKKEELQDEKVQGYVDVLDRQSARLKKLIEDLMEASKASTGNLTVELAECDVEVLLTQVIGEFEEKLEKNQLEVVVDKPECPVKMMADGRHMWRVLDNLLNNACKYSLPGSRVYVSLRQEGNEAVIVFKNISKTALNIPSEELMERFVRGDSSRNTEGSGLGLSIAQSLTELMQGSMKLEIDGDLFKVTLRFPMLTEK